MSDHWLAGLRDRGRFVRDRWDQIGRCLGDTGKCHLDCVLPRLALATGASLG